MEDKITAILKDEFLSADIADQDLNANLGNVVKIEAKDYNRLNNKPQINGVTLQGDKSALELGLVPTDLSKLEAVEQPTKSVRQTADMFVDNDGKPSKIALQQVKGMATKVVYANELGNVDFEKLDIDDYVILGDKIYRVVDAENNIKQLLPETSAEHVTFADKQGEYTSTNVEDALAEVMDIAKTGGVTGVKGDAETAYRKGNVNITKANIGLDQVDNTADLDKPISNAQSAKNDKLESEIRGVGTVITNHKNDKDNPHSVTKAQIGLGNVDNTADLDKPISNAQKTVNAGFEHNFEQLNSNIDTLGKGLNERIDVTNSNLTALRESTESALSNQQESINDIDSTLNSHIANQSNPHSVTKAQIGLDKVDNTADVDKIVKEAGKATNDGAGNNIVDTYASKQYVQEGLAGKSRSIAFANYQAFVTAVNGYGNTTLKVSDNVFVKTLGVPDMWVTAVNSEKAAYTYTNDQAIVNALNTTNGLTVGYYTFSQLETTKVDLTSYQTKTDDGLNTTDKTVVGAINEVKGTADSALSKANANATEISKIKDGTTKVKEAEHADTTDNATNVTTNINGKAISSIFETNGTTAKEATHAVKATSADNATRADSASKVANSLTFSGQNAQGTESTIGFDGSQAQDVAFNGDDFVATKGNAFEVSLAPSGVTAGTYNNVTIDEKGRATAGSNKDYATVAQVNAKYTKPESGIPKSDLAEDVKTSLGKADTALQNVPSYNDLPNIPVINQDLTASGFTPVANTYYKHTGTTTDLYTNGVIYFYNGTKYASLDGSTAVTEQVTVAVDDWVLDCITYKQVPVNPIESGDNFGVLYFDTTKTPDFSAINAVLSENEDFGLNIISNAGSRSNPYNPELHIAVRSFRAGRTMNGTTFTSRQWGIEYYKRSPDEEVDTYFYATDELSTALGFAASGWQTARFIDMDTLFVKNTKTYFSASGGRGFLNWDEYISKDGQWKQVPVGSSTIHPFTYRASKTLGTEMNANSVVSLGYNDTASMRECVSACVAIGEVPTDSGNSIIFYSVTKPTQAVNLVVEISETTTNS